MIDIHCHLLFGIDDGSKSLENSLNALRDLTTLGYTDIILTPHYVYKTNYSSSKDSNIKIMNELKKVLKKEHIDINLYLGNEIFINNDILKLLKNNEIVGLNNSKYLLIELPLSGEFEGYIDVFEELMDHGYTVILAHPERYGTFQKDFNKVLELEKMGIYFQSNLESIVGSYGKGAKKLIKKLLKLKKISFLATDIHHAKHDYTKYIVAKKKILKYISEKEFDELTSVNPNKILHNEDI